MLDGLKLAFDELGYQTASRKIELIVEGECAPLQLHREPPMHALISAR
jgi:hypothetical protein